MAAPSRSQLGKLMHLLNRACEQAADSRVGPTAQTGDKEEFQMGSLSNAMQALVSAIRSSTTARHAGVGDIRDLIKRDLRRFRRERGQMVRRSTEGVHCQLRHIRQTSNDLRQATRKTLGQLASDLSAARRLWSAGSELRVFSKPATKVLEQPLQAGLSVQVREASGGPPERERSTDREQVLRVVKTHPDGIRLVDIGNEMGVDWRGLIALTRSLLDEGKVEKIEHLYYPVEDSAK